LSGAAVSFCHLDNTKADAGRVWILWAAAGAGDAEAGVPTVQKQVRRLLVDGSDTLVTRADSILRVHLPGDKKMAPPVLLIDRPEPSAP